MQWFDARGYGRVTLLRTCDDLKERRAWLYSISEEGYFKLILWVLETRNMKRQRKRKWMWRGHMKKCNYSVLAVQYDPFLLRVESVTKRSGGSAFCRKNWKPLTFEKAIWLTCTILCASKAASKDETGLETSVLNKRPELLAMWHKRRVWTILLQPQYWIGSSATLASFSLM